MPTVRRSLWSLWLVWIVCLGLSIGGYALAASGLADKGMERLAQAWDVVSQAIKVTLATTLAGEDVTADVQKVESRFSNLPTGATTSKMSSDTAIKNAPGFLKRMTCWSDAVATAGNIKLLDNTVAGAGNALLDFDVLAVAYLPFTIEFDVPFSVCLYFDVTPPADLVFQVPYR